MPPTGRARRPVDGQRRVARRIRPTTRAATTAAPGRATNTTSPPPPVDAGPTALVEADEERKTGETGGRGGPVGCRTARLGRGHEAGYGDGHADDRDGRAMTAPRPGTRRRAPDGQASPPDSIGCAGEDLDARSAEEAGWRRRWDLNPRYPYGYSTLAGWCTRPNYATSPDVRVHCTGRGGLVTSPPTWARARTGGAVRLSPIRRTRSVCDDACAGPDRLTPRVSMCQPRDVPLAHVAAVPDPPNRRRSPSRTRRRREPPVGENTRFSSGGGFGSKAERDRRVLAA